MLAVQALDLAAVGRALAPRRRDCRAWPEQTSSAPCADAAVPARIRGLRIIEIEYDRRCLAQIRVQNGIFGFRDGEILSMLAVTHRGP